MVSFSEFQPNWRGPEEVFRKSCDSHIEDLVFLCLCLGGVATKTFEEVFVVQKNPKIKTILTLQRKRLVLET